MGRSQTFTGTAVSAVETILLAVEAQFHWGGAHISCSKCVKPHQSSVIRSAGIFFPQSLLCPPSLTPLNLHLLLLKVPNVSFLASLFAMSPLIFSSPISSSFTVLSHSLLHLLCPSFSFLRSLLFFFLCPHFYPFSRSSINDNSGNGMYPLKRHLSRNSEML